MEAWRAGAKGAGSCEQECHTRKDNGWLWFVDGEAGGFGQFTQRIHLPVLNGFAVKPSEDVHNNTPCLNPNVAMLNSKAYCCFTCQQ